MDMQARHAAGNAPGQAVDKPDHVYRWLLLALIVIGYAIYNLDKSVLSILIEPLKAEFGLTDTAIGSLTGIVTALPFALACLPLGLLADRVNRKRLLVVLIGGWSAMTALCGLASTAALLFIARAGVGAFEAGYAPISISVLSDSFPRRQRATAMGMFSLGAPLGVFFGLAIGGYVAATFGWRAAFWTAGLPGAALALVLALVMREPLRGRFDDGGEIASRAPVSAALTELWRNRPIFYVAVGMTCGATVLAAIAIWIPSFLIRAHGYSVHDAGLAAAVVIGVSGAVGAAAGGALSDRLSRRAEWRRLLMPVLGPLVSTAFGLTALLVVRRGDLVLLLLAPMAFFGQFYIGAGYATVSSLTPARARGATLAVLLIAFNIISNNLGAMLVGVLSDRLRPTFGAQSISYGIAVTTLFSLAASVALYRAMQLIRNDGRAAATPA
jgi:predicted MFS family arabinose efflux permease